MPVHQLFFLHAVLCSTAALSVQELSPDRARVAYLSDEDQNDVFELFGVPVDGSAPSVRLNSALPSGGDVITAQGLSWIEQTAGDRVLFIADQLTDGVHELFSVPDDASAPPVRVSGQLVTGGDVSAFLVVKQRVVYMADATVDNRDALFSVPLDGSSAPIPLTSSLGDVNRLIQLSRDGSLVVFTTADGLREFLHVVRTDGSQPPLLLDDSGTPGIIGYTYFHEIEIAPGDMQVVYVAAEDDDEAILGDILSARLDGNTPPVKLNPGGRFVVLPSFSRFFRIAPDGQRVLYPDEDAAFIDIKMHSVRLDGTGLVDLVPGGESGDRRNFRISADGVYAVFPSHGSGGTSLQRSRLDGTQSLTLLDPIAATIIGLELVPGGNGLVYATGNIGNNTRLFSLQVPNQPLSLIGNPPASQGADLSIVNGFEPLGFTPDGQRVVFRGDLTTDEVSELYSSLLDGSQPALRLNPPLSGNLDVLNFRLSPDGKRVLYRADQSANDVFELFSVPVGGSGVSVRLNQTPVTGGDVITFAKPELRGRVMRGP